jgi:hypothetical protein
MGNIFWLVSMASTFSLGAKHCEFYVLHAGFCCIPVKTRRQLNYLQITAPSEAYFEAVLRKIQNSLSLRTSLALLL